MADFSELLAKQKKDQTKEQVAISEAAQDYALKVQLEEGLTGDFLKGGPAKSIKGETDPKLKVPISSAAISIVRNFQQDLDMIADIDTITEFKSIIGKYQSLLQKLPDSFAKNRFSEREVQYISKAIAPVLAELHPLTNAFAKVRFGFAAFVKQFKPIKIAEKVLGNVPILGQAIKQKIATEERGSEELRRAEKQKGKDIAGQARKSDEGLISGVGATDSAMLSDIASDVKEVKEEVKKEPGPIGVETQYGMDQTTFPGVKGTAAEESREEREAVERDEYETNRNLFEVIAENTAGTNELLEELIKGGGGGGDGGFMETAGATALGAGAGGVGTAAIASRMLKKGSKVGKPPKSNLASKAKNLAKSTTRGVGAGLKTGARVAGRIASRAFLPLMAGLAIWDAAKGVANAAEILGKEKEDLTLRDKASAATGSLLEGLSFGLIKKDKVAKWMAGKQESKQVTNEADLDKSIAETGGVVEGKNLKDVVNIDSKRTVVRTILETENLENLIKKMLPDAQSNSSVYQDNKQITTASTNQILSDIAALNNNYTVKNVGADNE